jgi:WD40 repeat protein
VNSAAFSPDGSRIITASNDNTAKVWDATTGAAIVTLAAHEDAVDGVAFSPTALVSSLHPLTAPLEYGMPPLELR